jgi:hypothetical protein
MSITRVQSKTANTGGSLTFSSTLVFDASPAAGNILVIAIASLAAATPVIPTSANTTWVTMQANGGSSTLCTLAIGFPRASAGATVTVLHGGGGLALAGAEYAGLSPLSFDVLASAVGSSTSAASGSTPTTSVADELWIGAISARNTPTFSSPTNSFGIVGQTVTSIGTTNDRSVALLERIVTSTGTANAGATLSGTNNWAAIAATFSAVASGGGLIGGGNLSGGLL